MGQTQHNIVDNKENMRFEIKEGHETAFMEYRFYNKSIALMHTEVPEAFKGQGLANALAVYAFDYAKSHQMPVMVYCPFVAAFVKRHPEYQAQLDTHYHQKPL